MNEFARICLAVLCLDFMGHFKEKKKITVISVHWIFMGGGWSTLRTHHELFDELFSQARTEERGGGYKFDFTSGREAYAILSSP